MWKMNFRIFHIISQTNIFLKRLCTTRFQEFTDFGQILLNGEKANYPQIFLLNLQLAHQTLEFLV